MNRFKQSIQTFYANEHGYALDISLVTGLISLPLILFLIVYGQNVVQWVKTKTPNMMEEVSHWQD